MAFLDTSSLSHPVIWNMSVMQCPTVAMSPTGCAVVAVVVVPVLGGASTRVLKSNRIRQMLPLAGQMVYLSTNTFFGVDRHSLASTNAFLNFSKFV